MRNIGIKKVVKVSTGFYNYYSVCRGSNMQVVVMKGQYDYDKLM